MIFVPHRLAYFTQHNALQFHPCCCNGYKLLLSLCYLEFHCVNIPSFLDLLVCWWALRLHTEGPETYEKMLSITSQQGDSIETTMRYHLIPIRVANINKSRNKCWRGWGEKAYNCNWITIKIKTNKQIKINKNALVPVPCWKDVKAPKESFSSC